MGYCFMEENLNEKEFYKGSITGMIENMDLHQLVFAYVFIKEAMKKNEKDN